MQRPICRSGFTILELSVVILVIALVTGIGITATVGLIEQSKVTATENKLNEIEKALMAYRTSKNRLPCPGDLALGKADANYGYETADPGVCTGVTFEFSLVVGNPAIVGGAVPVKTLNLPDEYMYDGWGRKIQYSVAGPLTSADSFGAIMPNESCGITVGDASGDPRTSGAVYTLVSFGPNGHGAYVQEGGRMSAGSTNTDEAANCDCDSTGAPDTFDGEFVQKAPTGDPAVSVDVFDDIVRFKDRWQMETYDDTYKYSGYKGPGLIVGYDIAGSSSVLAYEHRCGAWSPSNGLVSMTNIPEDRATVAFTPGNRHVSVYSSTGCNLYKIRADGNYADLGSISSCPAYDTLRGMAISNNGYMAMVHTAVPYLQLWKLVENEFVPLTLATALFNSGAAPGTTSPVAPTMVAFSKDATYLALATTTAVNIYRRSGDTFTSLAPAAITAMSIPANGITGIAFSPDGKYFATIVNNVLPSLRVWSISNTSAAPFTAITGSPFSPGATLLQSIAFSPDGRYLAVGGGSGGGNNMVIYNISATGTFTAMALPDGWINNAAHAPLAIAFSQNSKYIAIVTSDSSASLALFERTSSMTYKTLGSYVSAADPGVSVDFSE